MVFSQGGLNNFYGFAFGTVIILVITINNIQMFLLRKFVFNTRDTTYERTMRIWWCCCRIKPDFYKKFRCTCCKKKKSSRNYRQLNNDYTQTSTFWHRTTHDGAGSSGRESAASAGSVVYRTYLLKEQTLRLSELQGEMVDVRVSIEDDEFLKDSYDSLINQENYSLKGMGKLGGSEAETSNCRAPAFFKKKSKSSWPQNCTSCCEVCLHYFWALIFFFLYAMMIFCFILSEVGDMRLKMQLEFVQDKNDKAFPEQCEPLYLQFNCGRVSFQNCFERQLFRNDEKPWVCTHAEQLGVTCDLMSE